ncbi:MAG: glutamate--tRNA ligase [Nitrospinae bacterium]|nr:glutamate--tRNA ligase [Nitrospinota bacterium]
MEITARPFREVRVRFAPSPTGPLHAGNMRTAVFNWLYAKSAKGKFILRIEDTDVERSTEEYSREILESLAWLGIGFDEGPHHQSHRMDIYRRIVGPMLAKNRVYPCFCTAERLEEDRREAEKRSRPPVYPGRCAAIDLEEARERMEKEPYSLRFRITGDDLTFHDAIRGPVTFNLRLMGDFIVVRSNNIPTYNLAAAIDDILMNISHVIRGEDHLSNTPKQILIMKALGFPPPVYAHLPLILAEDGTKLSKRHANSSFRDLIDGGYLPEAALNFLALIGWHPADNVEEMTADDMLRKFALESVALRPAHYNLEKLDWLNRQKLHHIEPERLLAIGKPFIKEHATAFDALPLDGKLFLMSAARENIARLTDLDAELTPFFEYAPDAGLKDGLKEYKAEAVATALRGANAAPDIAAAAKSVQAATGLKGKALYLPLRAALTGRLHGPELKYFYGFLSPLERERRIDLFLEHLRS